MEQACALCLELPMIRDRLFRAGLLRTAHAMDAVVRAVGYETAEHVQDEERRSRVYPRDQEAEGRGVRRRRRGGGDDEPARS